MTDNPLPTPRRSPDSEPPLPAWMTLPGSLAQPSSPSAEDTPDPSSPEDAPQPEDAPFTDDAAQAGDAAQTDDARFTDDGPFAEDAGPTDGTPLAEAGRTDGATLADDAGSADGARLGKAAGSAEEALSADGSLSQEAQSDSASASAAPSGAPGPAPSGAGSAGRGAVEFGAMRAPEEAGVSEAGGASVLDGRAVGGVDAALGGSQGRGGEGFEEGLGAAEEGQERAGEGPTLEAALEAILLVVDEPVSEVTLAQVLERPTHEVVAALRGLAAEYTAAGRGFDLRDVAGGWRFYTRADCAPLVERFVRDGQQTRLTQAALETLAVVAYRQPVSRARVAAVRGVNSDGVMRTLVARGLVEEAGTDPESQAVLYRTSSYFLERLGLRDLSELPELAPFLPDDVENLEETTK